MLALDWAHLAAASIWIGGLLGLLVLAAASEAGSRVAALAAVVPRFSRAAIVSVAVLLATGIVASIVHLPTLDSLWETNYGLALIAKSVLLACALVLAAVNNLRSRPRLVAAAQRRDRALGEGAAQLLRRLVLGESVRLRMPPRPPRSPPAWRRRTPPQSSGPTRTWVWRCRDTFTRNGCAPGRA
jgi:copper transport protein